MCFFAHIHEFEIEAHVCIRVKYPYTRVEYMYVCKYIVYVNMLGQRNYTPVRITTCSQKPQPQTNIKSNPDIELS